MPAKLTITIPAYNQTLYLRKLLESLKEQTFQDFNLVIIDDQSSEDYPDLLKDFAGDFAIRYIRNERNFGAIGNMFKAINFPVETDYIVCLHEDDFLHNDYLQLAVTLLEENENFVFVGSTSLTFFNDEDYLKKKQIIEDREVDKSFSVFNSPDFIRYLLSGKHFTFGSVVYRTSNLSGRLPDLETFSVTCDRPFLLSLLSGQNNGAVLNDNYIFYRDHGYHDNRGHSLRSSHLLNLYKFYQHYLNLSDQNDKKIFFRNSTNNLLYAYHNLGVKDISLWEFINRGCRENLLNLHYLNKIGLFAIFSLLVGKKISFKLKTFLHNF